MGAYDLGRALLAAEADHLLQRRVEPLDSGVYGHGHHLVEGRRWCGVVVKIDSMGNGPRAEPERNPMDRTGKRSDGRILL